MSSQGPTDAGGEVSGCLAQWDTRCRRQLRHSSMVTSAALNSTQPAGSPMSHCANSATAAHRATRIRVRSQIIVREFYRAGTCAVNR